MALTIALPLVLLAGLSLWFGIRMRRSTGIPWARVVTQDTLREGYPPERPLYSRRYGLTGRPDYVIERRGALVPVEVKPGRIASEPYESDLMQLVSYCLLIEETTGHAPPYGLLRYSEHTFRIDYTLDLRDALLDLLDEMRDTLDDSDCARSHDDWHRCASCGFATQCDESLAE